MFTKTVTKDKNFQDDYENPFLPAFEQIAIETNEGHLSPERKYRYEYKWIGPVDKPIFISASMIEKYLGNIHAGNMPVKLDCFEWPLQLVREEFYMGGAYYLRMDIGNPITAFLRLHNHRIKYKARLYYGIWKAKVIATCHIWGMADYKVYEVCSWENIKIVAKVKGTFKRSK